MCEIYTDVEGVYSADPRIVPTARKLAHVSFDEMLEMAATGGRVLALRSVEFARNHGVKVHVRSSFTWAPGTWVTEEDPAMEQAIISGVTHDTSEAKITIEQVPDRPGVAASLFRTLAEAGINVDMIVQNVSTAGHTDISFTLPRDDVAACAVEMDKIVVETEAAGFRTDEHVGRVSLVGAGMKTHPGVAAKMFEMLAGEGINIEMISTSTIRISCVVHEDDVERAVQALHRAFGLETAVMARDEQGPASTGTRRRERVGAHGRDRHGRHRDAAHPRGARLPGRRAARRTRRRVRRAASSPFRDGEVTCEVLRDGCFDGLDLVIVDVDDDLSAEWAPQAAAAGAMVVDNSAAFRMDPDVPLVVAEVNPEDLAHLPKGIASCPNCTTMIPVTALAPLHRAARIDRMVVSTYQSVSGAGQVGLHELDAQWTKLAGRTEELRRAGTLDRPSSRARCGRSRSPATSSRSRARCKEEGYTSEEWKMVRETRKILHDDDIKCSGHLRAGPGVRRPRGVRERAVPPPDGQGRGGRAAAGRRPASGWSTTATASRRRSRPPGIDPVLVGRVREDPSEPGSLNLWITGDNLRKGAALNGVQMAEVLIAALASSRAEVVLSARMLG